MGFDGKGGMAGLFGEKRWEVGEFTTESQRHREIAESQTS
jgi:hypothetical protein